MLVGISTIQSENYGNRLKNYALQTVLKQQGYQVETLAKKRHPLLRGAKKVVRGWIKHDSTSKFHQFDREFIINSRYVASNDYVSKRLPSYYDKYVMGSDQIWNPYFPFNGPVEFLPFVDRSRKIAYAASFGVTSLGNKREIIAELIADIPHISMREFAGAEIVESLTGHRPSVVLDPTMLLTADDWNIVARKPASVDADDPFIFKYVLGNDVNDEEIESISKKYNSRIINVRDPTLEIGPSEFLWLAKNCKAVCTDSFHASVFALLYHKPLGIFERVDSEANMSSRYDTLCALFKADRCRKINEDFDMSCMNWNDFDNRLSELRSFSLNWLQDALGGGSSID